MPAFVSRPVWLHSSLSVQHSRLGGGRVTHGHTHISRSQQKPHIAVLVFVYFVVAEKCLLFFFFFFKHLLLLLLFSICLSVYLYIYIFFFFFFFFFLFFFFFSIIIFFFFIIIIIIIIFFFVIYIFFYSFIDYTGEFVIIYRHIVVDAWYYGQSECVLLSSTSDFTIQVSE